MKPESMPDPHVAFHFKTMQNQQCRNNMKARIIHPVDSRIPQFVFHQHIHIMYQIMRFLTPISHNIMPYVFFHHNNTPSFITL